MAPQRVLSGSWGRQDEITRRGIDRYMAGSPSPLGHHRTRGPSIKRFITQAAGGAVAR